MNELQHTSTLRPRARLIRAIGDELISNEVIAVLELVKNAYDADATSVVIHFEAPLTEGSGTLMITDDGVGMDAAVLRDAWLEPASDWKMRNPRSRMGRRVTGEKGLGRFAAARLADILELTSISGAPPRTITAVFDWRRVASPEKYLDELEWTWREEDAGDTPTGTALRLQILRDTWDEKRIRRLRSELSRLVANQSTHRFLIKLELPEPFSALAGAIGPPPVLRSPHYSVSGTVDERGLVKGTVFTDQKQEEVNFSVSVDGRPPECGPFQFAIDVWDRDRLDSLAETLNSTVRDLRRDLNEAAGISVYRDDFRIALGGTAGDWLRLDLRRVQNPTLRLSNNQIVGAVFITGDRNPGIRDQSNREGLVESREVIDFRETILALLANLEAKRYASRRGEPEKKMTTALFDGFELLEVSSVIRSKYPADKELHDVVARKERELQTKRDELKNVIVRYRRLATLGQLVDVVLHDGRTPLSAIRNEALLGLRDEGAASSAERFHRITRFVETLSNLFQRLAPLGGRRTERTRPEILEDLLANAVQLFASRIDSLNVEVTAPSSESRIRVPAGEVTQIIANLLDNALYWLEQVSPHDRRLAISVEKTENAVNVTVSDSGPGVSEEARDYVFEPYFSTRPHGIGLGLTIAGEAVADLGGQLELVSPGELGGATFRFTLPLEPS